MTATEPATEPASAELAVIPPQHVDIAAPIGMPSPGEWTALSAMAQQLARSGLAPKALRNKPDDMMLVLLTGRDLRLTATTAMNKIHVIEGKPTLSAELMAALVNRQPGMAIWPDPENSHERAVAHARRGDTELRFTFTWGDAVRAKLTGKDVWKSWPQFMLWARAVSGLCRMAFPDILAGVSYTPEELGATVDEDGQVIDVSPGDYPAVGAEPVDRDAAAREAGWATADEADADHLRLRARAESADPVARRRTSAWAKRHNLSPHFKVSYDEILAAAEWFDAHRAAELEAPQAPFDAGDEDSLGDIAALDAYARHLAGADSPQEPPAGPDAPTPPTEADRPQEAASPPDPAESEPVGPERPNFARLQADVRGAIKLDARYSEPCTPGQRGKVVGILQGWDVTDRADRLRVLEVLIGRPFTTSNELTKGEAGAIIETVPSAPKKPKEPKPAEDDPDDIIERVRSMSDDEVVAELGRLHLSYAGNARLTLAEHLAGIVKDVP